MPMNEIQMKIEHQVDCLYEMEFQMIPAVLMVKMPGNTPDDDFRVCSLRKLRSIHAGIAEGVDWSAMSMNYYSSDELKYLFFEFPQPLREPLAYYGMVIKYRGQEMKYYTLEMSSEEGVTFFCRCSQFRHSLLRTYEGDLSAQAFMQYVLDYHKKH